MSAWRAAGISYVRFSFVASNAMKKALKPEALGKLRKKITVKNKYSKVYKKTLSTAYTPG